MTCISNLNLFFKSNKDYSNIQKISKLNQCSTRELLTLLRNIEECPKEYDEEIIRCVYSSLLFDKRIMFI